MNERKKERIQTDYLIVFLKYGQIHGIYKITSRNQRFHDIKNIAKRSITHSGYCFHVFIRVCTSAHVLRSEALTARLLDTGCGWSSSLSVDSVECVRRLTLCVWITDDLLLCDRCRLPAAPIIPEPGGQVGEPPPLLAVWGRETEDRWLADYWLIDWLSARIIHLLT